MLCTFFVFDSQTKIEKQQAIYRLQTKISEEKDKIIKNLSDAAENLNYALEKPDSVDFYLNKAKIADQKTYFNKDIIKNLEDNLTDSLVRAMGKPQKYKIYIKK